MIKMINYQNPVYKKRYKVVVCGDSCVGKSRYVSYLSNKDVYNRGYLPTLFPKVTKIPYSNIELELCELPGSYKKMDCIMYADAVIVMFSDDFDSVIRWKKRIEDYLHGIDIPILYINNIKGVVGDIHIPTWMIPYCNYVTVDVKGRRQVNLSLDVLVNILS